MIWAPVRILAVDRSAFPLFIISLITQAFPPRDHRSYSSWISLLTLVPGAAPFPQYAFVVNLVVLAAVARSYVVTVCVAGLK